MKLMQKRRVWWYTKLMVAVLAVAVIGTGTVFATTSTSPNYQVTETQFGSGTGIESCSGQYCAQVTIGDPGGANKAYSASFGTLSESEPVLEVIIEPGQSNLGVLSPKETASKTTIVRIRNHLSGGYILQIYGDPPKFEDHTLRTPALDEVSQPGTEQFGMNLVNNTSPLVGANPLQVPADQQTFGEAMVGYNTMNRFKYVSGDTVARSLTESGRTDYTISMIVNISTSTPPGNYSGDFSAIVMPVY